MSLLRVSFPRLARLWRSDRTRAGRAGPAGLVLSRLVLARLVLARLVLARLVLARLLVAGLAIVVTTAVPASPAAAGDAPVPQALRAVPLTISGAKGRKLAVTAEVALTEAERNIGLMYRRKMADDHGMLFLFSASRPVSFWMQNTYIALDLLFIDARGVITGIAANAEPMSLDILSSPGPVVAVLEINGGLAARLGIGVGDRVDYPSELRGKAR